MDDEEAGAADVRQGPPPKSDSIQASVERLIASGKDLAEAEISWAKLKGRSLAALLRRGLILTILATTGLMVGFSLLLVALIVALAPLVGGLLYATLIVIALSFALAAIFGVMAHRTFRRLLGEDES
ncbi:MAG: hypothetical protein J7494_10845 [Sphingobium sp.]|nr:hypothetical protein [Sphingobium sp.]